MMDQLFEKSFNISVIVINERVDRLQSEVCDDSDKIFSFLSFHIDNSPFDKLQDLDGAFSESIIDGSIFFWTFE